MLYRLRGSTIAGFISKNRFFTKRSYTSLIQKDKEQLNIDDYDYTVNSMRDFFKERGWKEVNTQHRRSILAACEDPWTIKYYNFEG